MVCKQSLRALYVYNTQYTSSYCNITRDCKESVFPFKWHDFPYCYILFDHIYGTYF